MFFDMWISLVVVLMIIAMMTYKSETGHLLTTGPGVCAFTCTNIAVCSTLVLQDIGKINPSLELPIKIIGSIAAVIGMVILTIVIIMTINTRRMQKRWEQERRETVESEDFARFIDEDLGMIITVDKSRGIMTVLVKEESDDETQED